MFAGRLFQSLGAASEKARLPQLEMKNVETTRKPCVAERKKRVGTYVSSKSIGYHFGTQPSIEL